MIYSYISLRRPSVLWGLLVLLLLTFSCQQVEEKATNEPLNSQAVQPVAIENGAALLYEQLFPGIDLRLYQKNSLAYDFLLSPGAEVSEIKFQVGPDAKIEADGSLLIEEKTYQVKHSAPYAFQEIEGQEVFVESSFKILEATVEFGLNTALRPIFFARSRSFRQILST